MAAQLSKHLRFWDSVSISVGIVIGVGIFKVPAQVAKYLTSTPETLIAWFIGGLITLLGVFCYAELSSKFPHTGGTYVYLREAFGKFTGFMYGWAEFSINRAASIAAVAYIFAAYLRTIVPYPAETEKWVALSAVLFFTWVNIIGVRFGVKVQNILSLFKVLAMLTVAALIFLFSKSSSLITSNPFEGIQLKNAWYLAPALIPILWTYGGWHESTFMSGEFHDTKKELPLSIITSALIVMGLYLLMNAAYLKALTPFEIIESKAIAADALKKIFGSTGSIMITIAILISASGALNSNILTGARVPFAVGQDCPRLDWMGHVHDKFKTPLRALVLNAAWACVLILWGNFERLLFFNAFEIWLFFILVGISVFVLRGKKTQEGSNFLMVGYPFVPLGFTLVAIWLCVTTIIEAPQEALFGALIILLGAPVYFFVRSKPVLSR